MGPKGEAETGRGKAGDRERERERERERDGRNEAGVALIASLWLAAWLCA